jgi:hypothetical protein
MAYYRYALGGFRPSKGFMSLCSVLQSGPLTAYDVLQEDDPDTLHLIVSFLLFDGRQHEESFRMMNEEGSFPRLLELLQVYKIKDGENQAALHRMLMDLLYEMSRIQRIRIEDLGGCFRWLRCLEQSANRQRIRGSTCRR